MSSEAPTSLQDLAEFAAGILADALSLRDRVTDLENDGMKIRAIVDAADQLHSAAAWAVRELTAEVDAFSTMSEEWKASTAKYLKARNEAGTKAGDEYAARLAAMPPDDAAKEICDMFALCADEDLKEDISCDLQLPYKVAERIAEAIVRLRAQAGDEYAARLAAMPPDDAAKEICDMFGLCCDEDLAGEISGDLQLPYEAAKPIAEAIILQRAQRGAGGKS